MKMKKKFNQAIQNKLKNNFYYNFYLSNKTQIIVISFILFPTLLLMLSTYLVLNYFQSVCFQLVNNFSNDLLQDQIKSSKILNSAIVFQLSSQTQKFVWYINLLNEFFGNIIQEKVLKNEKHIPSILNIYRTYTNQESNEILMLFKNNSIFTSSWHQVNKSQVNQLDDIELQQLDQSIRIESLEKSILFVNKYSQQRQMVFKDLFFAFCYDGLLYTQGVNTTFQSYKPPQNCPYQGQFHLDIRCRYYYNQTVSSISTIIYRPQVFYSNANPLIVQSFCQRRLKYESLDPNSKSSNYSLICLNIDLTFVPTYFKNFGSNSKLQILLNPQYQTVIYNSAYNLGRTEIVTIQQIETNYLQDQSQASNFINMVQQNNQFIINNTNKLDFIGFNYESYEQIFEYQRNETECLVLKNQITIIDKVPKFETLKSVDPSPKYQIKNAFIFLNIISKEKMLQYCSVLNEQIQYYNFLFMLISLILMLAILLVQIVYSFLLGKQTLKPIIHLTSILKQLIDQSGDGLNQNFCNLIRYLKRKIFMIILIKFKDKMINQQASILKFSKSINVSLATHKNYLIALGVFSNFEIQHFNKFNNLRALGVCYNNIGVIHYNCGRYQESVENFQRSIIYAKYELGYYQNSSYDGQQQNDDQKTNQVFQAQQNLFNQNDFQDSENWKEDCSKIQQQNEKTGNGKMLLFWSLYNRTINLIKALFSHISENNLLDQVDMLEEIILDIEKISQKYLPVCQKREIMECFMKCNVYKLQKNQKDYFNLIEKFKNLYIYHRKTKTQNCPLGQIEQNKTLHQTEEEIKFLYQNSFHTLLMKPLSKNKQIKKNNLFKKYKSSQNQMKQSTLKSQAAIKHRSQTVSLFQSSSLKRTKSSALVSDQSKSLSYYLKQYFIKDKADLKHYQPYFQVRKNLNQKKLCKYQFSSDILFQYYALEQVSFQIMVKNYFNAGLIITNLLEKCIYYFPFLKMKAFKIAASLFQLQKVQIHIQMTFQINIRNQLMKILKSVQSRLAKVNILSLDLMLYKVIQLMTYYLKITTYLVLLTTLLKSSNIFSKFSGLKFKQLNQITKFFKKYSIFGRKNNKQQAASLLQIQIKVYVKLQEMKTYQLIIFHQEQKVIHSIHKMKSALSLSIRKIKTLKQVVKRYKQKRLMIKNFLKFNNKQILTNLKNNF
ncbi:hypothetical protein ABPG72_002565 [Tetrahymena utriculariae]